ncbi:hypothetical protein DL98DRAFT_542223 [Cadophora sp. DSE1049]|nr:hypothetical protein DL98DRAFT_542223 [Cadophora sp. DSE1049]
MFGRQCLGAVGDPKVRGVTIEVRPTFAKGQRSATQTPRILSCWGYQLQGTTEVVIDTAGAQTGCGNPQRLLSTSRPQKRHLMQLTLGSKTSRGASDIIQQTQWRFSQSPLRESKFAINSLEKIHQPGFEVCQLKSEAPQFGPKIIEAYRTG